jgi:uncharacterized Fe-S cluster protein YjdI
MVEETVTGIERTYQDGRIIVHWRPDLCQHSGNCVRSLPEVFRPRERPWITLDAASADAIAEAVGRCPSGALSAERLDGEGPNAPSGT